MSCKKFILLFVLCGTILTSSAQVNFQVGETWLDSISIDRLSFSEDGRIYYIYNNHRSIAFYDLIDGPTDLTTQFNSEGFTYFIDLIISVTTVYVAANQGQLAIFANDTAKLFYQFDAPYDSLTSISLSSQTFYIGDNNEMVNTNIAIGTINGLFNLTFDVSFVQRIVSDSPLYSYDGTGYAYDGEITLIKAPYTYSCPAENVVTVHFPSAIYVTNVPDSLNILDFQCKRYSPYISVRPAFYLGTDEGLFWRYWECGSGYSGHYMVGQQIHDVQFFSPFAPLQSFYQQSNYTLAAGSNGVYYSGDEHGASDRYYTQISGTDAIHTFDLTINSCAGEVYAASESGIIQIKSFDNKSFIPYIADRISPPGESSFCARDSFEISTGLSYGFEVQWFRNNDTIPGEIDYIYKTAFPGTYKYAINNCFFETLQYSDEVVLKLDQMVNFTWNNLDVLNTCALNETLSVETDSANQIVWFRDGQEIDRDTTSIVISSSGNYHAQITNCNGFSKNSKTTVANFARLTKPVIRIENPITCSYDTARITYSNYLNGSIGWYINGNLIDSLSNQTTILTTAEGSYDARVYNIFCDAYSEIFELKIQPDPVYELIGNTYYCEGLPTTLEFQIDPIVNLYVNDQLTSIMIIDEDTDLLIRVEDQLGCYVLDTISISGRNLPPISVPEDTSLCFGEKKPLLLLNPYLYTAYLDGDRLDGDGEITSHGTYDYMVEDSLGCISNLTINVMDQCPNILIPNVFTPNGDGINESFVIENLIPDCRLKIFTRNGDMVFSSDNYNNSWTGDNLGSGTYFYRLENRFYDKAYKGYVHIMR